MPAAERESRPAGPSRPVKAIALIVAAIGAVLLVAPPIGGLSPDASRALGLVIIAVAFWATEALPPHITAFLFFTLAVVLKIAPPPVVFSGFHAGAVWLIFGGVVLGIAIQRTGLGSRLAEAVLARCGHSRKHLIFGIALTAFGLAFIMPSAMSRVVLLVPIVTALAERVGYPRGSPGHDGMVMAAAFSTVVPPMGLLPATVPNVVLSGLVESIYGITLKYGPFLILNLPVAGLLSLVAIILLVMAFSRDHEPQPFEPAGPASFSGAEKRLTAVLALTIILWMTDSIHGVAPAWVALGAAVVCLLPIAGLVPPKVLAESVNYAPWFFVAGIIGLGAVVNDSGLAKTLGALLIDVSGLAPDNDAYNFGAMIGIGTLLSLLVNQAGAAAVLTPLAGDIAAATGWPPETAMLVQVAGFMVALLPYQVAPIMTAMLLGNVRYGRMVRLCFAFTAVYIVVITPLNFLWWRWLGMFGGAP